MARSRKNYHPAVEEEIEETDIGPRAIHVEEKDAPVRVRTGPGTNYGHVFGEYLGKGMHEISEVSDGIGSKSGWGRLADGRGWIALDFVKQTHI